MVSCITKFLQLAGWQCNKLFFKINFHFGDFYLSPKIELPILTIVAPSSMAII